MLVDEWSSEAGCCVLVLVLMREWGIHGDCN